MRRNQRNLTSNREIVHLLRSLAAAHLIKNKNRFQIIAYENAADSVDHLNREIKDLWQEGKLDAIPNIGKTITSGLDEYFRKGYSRHFQSIFKGIPDTVFELMRIPSLGPKKAYKLVKAFRLRNKDRIYDDLKLLCESGKVAKLPNFGQKSQEAILRELEHYLVTLTTTESSRMPLPYANALANELIEYMLKNKNVLKVEALGSLRRMMSTIGDIDLCVLAKKENSEQIVNHFIHFYKKTRIENSGEKKAAIIVEPGIRVDLRVQEVKNYGSMLQYFTGNKDHNIKLREFALKKNLSLSEWGIKSLKTKKLDEFSSEQKFYKFLGLDYIPPEIREGTNEIESAKEGKLPKLVKLEDIKGDLHIHSNYNLKPSHDFGLNNFNEICKKAKSLNYEYVGFSEHNPKITDLPAEQIITIMKKRQEYIQRILKKNSFHFFIGLEVDILPSGALALPEKAFAYVDYLLASVHSSFRMGVKEMTQRVLKALDSPKVKILGHPTGRLLNKREGYQLEWDKIFDKCKQKNIALEINAWPERLDLPDVLVREGLKYGVKLMINTDAHANEHMDNMKYGVTVARRGWAEKNDILNTLDYKNFKQWIKN